MVEAPNELFMRVDCKLSANATAQHFEQWGGPIDAFATLESVQLGYTGASAAASVKLGAVNNTVDVPTGLVLRPGGPGALAEAIRAHVEAGGRAFASPEAEAAIERGAPFVLGRPGAQVAAAFVNCTTSIGGHIILASGGSAAEPAHALLHDNYSTLSLRLGNSAASQSAVTVANPRFVTADGAIDAQYVQLEHARADVDPKQVVQQYAERAWATRNPNVPGAHVYKPAPTLHKSTAVCTSGHVPLAAVVDPTGLPVAPPAPAAFEAALALGVATVLGVESGSAEVATFLDGVGRPGGDIGRQAELMGTALSLVNAAEMPYKPDGIVRVDPSTGTTQTVSVEFWARDVKREKPLLGDDCDQSATRLYHKMRYARGAVGATDAQRPATEALGRLAVLHVPALSIVGATGAEASGGGGGDAHSGMQGHAIAMMLPARELIGALRTGETAQARARLNPIKRAFYDDAPHKAHEAARLEAYVGALTAAQRAVWDAAGADASLRAVPIEGTTPAEARFVERQENRARAAARVRDEARAKAAVGAIAFAPLSTTHVEDPAHGLKSFVQDTVELVLPSEAGFDSPPLRALGIASQQLVMVQPSGDHAAGCTASQMATGAYAAAPLVPIDAPFGEALDAVKRHAACTLMPPAPPGPTVLTEAQAKTLRANVAAMAGLKAALQRATDTAGAKEPPGTVDVDLTYVVPEPVLVFNEAAVGVSIAQIEAVAVGGDVEQVALPGRLRSPVDAEDVGVAFVVHVTVRLPASSA